MQYGWIADRILGHYGKRAPAFLAACSAVQFVNGGKLPGRAVVIFYRPLKA